MWKYRFLIAFVCWLLFVLFVLAFMYGAGSYQRIEKKKKKPGLIPVGTKSVLFGAHCFFTHTVFVAIAWIKLYGFPFDRKIWLAFVVHDLGYWGKPNMDGEEGETHPELGAKIMGYFGKEWHDFSLYHSRYYAKRNGANYSKLCVADKLAFCIEPYWLYITKATLTGEIHEYMNVHHNVVGQTKKEWHAYAVDYMSKWVEEHKNMKHNEWTKLQNEKRDWVEDFKFENGNYRNTCMICQNDFMGGKYRRICKECTTWNLKKENIEIPPPEIEPDLKPEDLAEELCLYWCSEAIERPSYRDRCEGSRCKEAYNNYLDREK